MKIVHVTMIHAGPDGSSYRAMIVNAKRGRSQGSWHGKIVDSFPDILRFPPDTQSETIRSECDSLARIVAAREELGSGPDLFPYAKE